MTFIQKMIRIILKYVNISQQKNTGGEMLSEQKKIIITTDMGWDDWLSIIYLAKHPKVDILGIVVNGVGESYINPGIQNLINLLDYLDQDIPVIKGSAVPMSYSNVFPAWLRENINRFLDIPLPQSQKIPSSVSMIDFFKQHFSAPTNTAVLSLGGLTNLALFLEDQPDLFKNIPEITMMGGAIETRGNIEDIGKAFYPTNFTSEWNFFIDPVAAKKVFETEVKKTLVPLDATKDVALNETNLQKIKQQAHEHPTKAFELSLKILEKQYEAEVITGKAEDLTSGELHIFDPIAAMAITHGEKLLKFKQAPIRVIDELNYEDNQAGRTIIDPVNGKETTYAYQTNLDVFIQAFSETLSL